MELYHHGVKGMRWGYRKDESTVAKLRSKNEKLNIKLKKRKAKLDKFNQSRGSVIAKKAEIRMARHRRIGLIASHYLAKSKKLEYKVAKIDRKILRNNKKINKIINRAFGEVESYDEIISEDKAHPKKWDRERDKAVKKANRLLEITRS